MSLGGVCGRSITAGKILFTWRQTCSLYYSVIASKILVIPKSARFGWENFLRYLGLCYVNPAYYKLKTSLLYAVNQSEASRNCFRIKSHLRGKGYFAALVHLCYKELKKGFWASYPKQYTWYELPSMLHFTCSFVSKIPLPLLAINNWPYMGKWAYMYGQVPMPSTLKLF